MEGNNSTADACQSGITEKYMAPRPNVLQHHDDDGDDNLKNTEVHGDKENSTERHMNLPIANVTRIMKNVVPQTGKIAKDAKELMQDCVSEFISFITSEASERCREDQRKTLNGEDILVAMSKLGFDMYVDPLKLYLQKFREERRAEKEVPEVSVGESLGEDLTEGSVPSSPPAGIITPDGQQQNISMDSPTYQ